MRKFGLTVILVLCVLAVARAQLNYANRLYDEQDFEGAIPLYEKVLKKDSTELEAIEKLANSYKKIKKYDLAEKYFSKAVTYEEADANSYLNYGQLLKNNKKVSQAREQFNKYLEKKPESLIGKVLLQSCDAIGEWTSQPTEYVLTNMKAINTEYLEIGPFPLGNALVFTSDKNYLKKDEEKSPKHSLDGEVFGIYIYDSLSNEEPIRSFSNDINSIDNIEGPAYFNKAEDRMYYTKVFSRQRYAVNQMELHIAYLEDGVWKKKDEFKFNDKDYSLTNPVLSIDGTKLYFASDMPGGEGGFDIYVSTNVDGEFGEPINLGKVINTSGHEIPSYIDENGTLYFSSNFHPGFGGLDIFKSKMGSEWSTPFNLKVPFNSSKDDLGFILTDSITGYFASNRDGGAGKDDIYYFTKHRFTDSSYYTDINGRFLLDTLPMMHMSLALLDENDEIVQMVVTNNSGQFSFKNVQSDKTYKILINEDPAKIPEEAKVYLTDERYRKIMLIERLKKGLFKFEALDRDEYDDLSLMDDVDDSGFPTLSVLGQLRDRTTNEGVGGKQVFVVDENEDIIASALSDHLGKFAFEKLSIDDEYLFRLAEDDPNIDIDIMNAKGKVVGRTVKNKDGLYVYHKFTINPSGEPDIRGVFKYGNLPADGVTLMLVDENDQVLMVTVTNVKGEFEFEKLTAGTSYRIKVDSTLKKIPKDANMFLMDKHTGLLLPVSKLANGEFEFETLSPIPPEEMALMDVEDFQIKPRHNIRGQVYSDGDKVIANGTVVQVQDENGNVIAIAETADKGIFKFYNLPVDDEYLFGIPEDDPDFHIRVLNDDDAVIGETSKNANNQYVYHKFSINPSKRPDIRGLFKYGNLPANDVTLNLLDETDHVVQVTKTNQMGEFRFTKLRAGSSYRVATDESNGPIPENANMSILDEHTGLMLPVSKLANGSFRFETLGMMEAEDIALMNEDDFIITQTNDLSGQVYSTENKEVPDGTIVELQDNGGNAIAFAKTKDKGSFTFFNLPIQDEYLFGITEDDPTFNIRVFNKDEAVVGETSKNKNNQYVYHKFTINPSENPDIRGVFKYGSLPANDVSLNLMDESDHIIQATVTNDKGEFRFTNLHAGEDYRIQPDESEGEIPENANMSVLDEHTGLMLPVSKLANGSFRFETLSMMDTEELALLEEDDETTTRFSFFAQLFSKLPMDLGENLELYIVDEDGNIIAMARSDKFGKFNFENLPFQDEYLLKLQENDPDIEIKIINKNGETLGILRRNGKGEFVYKRNELTGKELAGTDPIKKPSVSKKERESGNEDKSGMGADKPVASLSKEIPIIRFEFASAQLNNVARNELDKVFRTLKSESGVKLEISAHTDSRGPSEYNLWLSDQRANSVKKHLTDKGITTSRILTKNYGETKLLNECADEVPCSHEKHAVNRRTELKFIR